MWTLTWPLQNLNLVFLDPFRGGLAAVFGIIVLLHNQSALELEVTNGWPDILHKDILIECMAPSIMASRLGPEAAKHTTSTMFDYWYDPFMKCCVGFKPDLTGHTHSKMFNFCHISPQNICPKVLGIIKIFFAKCETSLWVIFGQQWLLPRNSPMDAIFVQSLSYCWVVNTGLNWGLQFFRCCSGFFYDLLDELSLRSWSNFGSPATLV